ncbi:hypothetical protein ACFL2V_11285 [Pseudomonadota bacterium]
MSTQESQHEEPIEYPPTQRPTTLEGKEGTEVGDFRNILSDYVASGRSILLTLEGNMHFLNGHLLSKQGVHGIDKSKMEKVNKLARQILNGPDTLLTAINLSSFVVRNNQVPDIVYEEHSGVYDIEQNVTTGKVEGVTLADIRIDTAREVGQTQMELPLKKEGPGIKAMTLYHDLYELSARMAPVIEQYSILVRQLEYLTREGQTQIDLSEFPGYVDTKTTLIRSMERLIALDSMLKEAIGDLSIEQAA